MTPREIVLNQINHHETSPVPYTLGFEDNIGAALDQHYGDSTWREKIIPYLSSCGGIDRRKSTPINESYNRDLFGSVWRTDKRPFHLTEPGLNEPSLKGYEFPTLDDFLEEGQKERMLEKLKGQKDSLSRIGLGWGLWESYWGIRGFENAMTDMVTEHGFVEELLDKLTDLYLDQVEYVSDVPADAVMFGDDWGYQQGVLVGPERWREFFKPRYAKIYEAVHKQGKLVLSHCCGSIVDIIPDVIEIGLDVLESVQPEARGMNPYELKERWGDKIAYWGGLGSQSTIPFGSPEEIRGEVRKLREQMSKNGGYILAPAKSLQPETPVQNAAAVFEAFTEED